MRDKKQVKDWPFHEFSLNQPFIEDEKFSILPNTISDQVRDFWGVEKVQSPTDLGYLLNISGTVYGEFSKQRTTDHYNMELPEYLRNYFDSVNQVDPLNEPQVVKSGNISFNHGKMSIDIKSLGYNYQNPEFSKFIYNKEQEIHDALMVKLKFSVYDEPELVNDEIETNGVYFQDTGAIILITSSAKFSGTIGLPSLTLNENYFNKSQVLISQLLNGTDIEKQVSMDDMNQYISKSYEKCEFINYIQLAKTEYQVDELREIDQELLSPTGKPINKELPKINIKKMIMYSPDCGVVFESTNLQGEKKEIVNRQVRHVLIWFIGLILVQLYLFMDQIRRCKTPGQLSNISSITLMMLQYQDALVALVFLLISTVYENLYLILACITIFTYIMCGVFEMGFLTQVMKAQINERATTWWHILRGAQNENTEAVAVAAGDSATEAPALPPPPPPPPPESAPTRFEGEDASIWNSIFAPGFAITIITTFLVLNSTMWRKLYRSVFEIIGLTVLNSFWVPQFFRNTLKNRRIPFTVKFIVGTTLVRLIPINYVFLLPNPFRHGQNIGFMIFLNSWVGLQLLLIYLQNVISPRFWINDKWLPKAYNYHPVINLNDLEHYGSDLLTNIDAESLQDDVITCKTDCIICMAPVELPIQKTNKKKLNLNKSYMITPCFHIFHSECLEDWMKYKLQCPICRNGLPPI